MLPPSARAVAKGAKMSLQQPGVDVNDPLKVLDLAQGKGGHATAKIIKDLDDKVRSLKAQVEADKIKAARKAEEGNAAAAANLDGQVIFHY